jgi:hypothetical protein
MEINYISKIDKIIDDLERLNIENFKLRYIIGYDYQFESYFFNEYYKDKLTNNIELFIIYTRALRDKLENQD